MSLEAQAAKIRAYCEFKGLELTEIIEEQGVSAFKLLTDRPGGKRLLDRLEDPTISHVIGIKLDRLFRNVSDCLDVVNDWHYSGVTLHLVDLGGQAFDSGSAVGKFFLTMIAAIAEWERSIIAERTRDALAHKKQRGDPLGTAPYGFRWVDGAKVPDPDEQLVLNKIVELRDVGHTLREIVTILNEEGITARSGAWHLTSVARLVKKFGTL